MTFSFRAHLTAGFAIVVASAVAVAPSLTPRPVCGPVPSHTIELTSPTIELTAAVGPLGQTPNPDIFPSLFEEVARGIVPSLGAPLPTPNIPAPAPTATNINQAIKNIYNAAEPWVRYGFELAAYAVGWVPYVGWLSPQILIFYNFGERIVRSITFNLDDWIFGPLPFLQGLGNVARDSWNALVQLGIDQWNFWLPPLPPLPPLPFAAQPASTPAATLPTTQQQPGPASAELQLPSQRPKPPAVAAKNTPATPHSPITPVEQTPGSAAATVASPLPTVTKAAETGRAPATVAVAARRASKALGNDAIAHTPGQNEKNTEQNKNKSVR